MKDSTIIKKLLFTGASGFLGQNILPLLRENYDTTTLGSSVGNDISADLAKIVPTLSEHYDIVLHAAGKAHVLPKTPDEIQEFYDTNFQGTVNLCKSLEGRPPKSFIFISTVAVYGCDFGENISEETPLNGTTPYAISKIMAERYLSEWCGSHGVKLCILRPPLIVGYNAKGNLGAMLEGIKGGFYLNIAGGRMRKGVLMADDIARLVPIVADRGGIYNVCDTNAPTIKQISTCVARLSGKRRPLSIPCWVAWCAAKLGDIIGAKSPFNSAKLFKLTHSLTFSNAKARKVLNWEPIDVLSNYKI